MNVPPSLKISYWAEQTGPMSIRAFEGMEEFKRDLSAGYVSVVHGRPGDLGGLYQFSVHFVSDISLSDVMSFLATGMAYDLLKSGAKSFVLKPFLDAYKKLQATNEWAGIDIEELRIEFQDSIITIDATYDQAIPDQLGPILVRLAKAYPLLVLSTGETPFDIRIPVLEDTSDDRLCRYRAMLAVDEMIAKRDASDYFCLWGLWYDYSRQFRIYDVQGEKLIDAEFLSRERYWAKWEERWRQTKGRE